MEVLSLELIWLYLNYIIILALSFDGVNSSHSERFTLKGEEGNCCGGIEEPINGEISVIAIMVKIFTDIVRTSRMKQSRCSTDPEVIDINLFGEGFPYLSVAIQHVRSFFYRPLLIFFDTLAAQVLRLLTCGLCFFCVTPTTVAVVLSATVLCKCTLCPHLS
jgi:hypothetical protein